jgi:glycosyltransferase involved in cell wall biosynthesis
VEEAIRLYAPRVLVLPQVTDVDMPSMYAGADAFVLPSRGRDHDIHYLLSPR